MLMASGVVLPLLASSHALPEGGEDGEDEEEDDEEEERGNLPEDDEEDEEEDRAEDCGWPEHVKAAAQGKEDVTCCCLDARHAAPATSRDVEAKARRAMPPKGIIVREERCLGCVVLWCGKCRQSQKQIRSTRITRRERRARVMTLNRKPGGFWV